MIRVFIIFVAIASSIFLLGCDTHAAYEQKIKGVILKNGKMANGLKVKFTSESSDATSEKGLETITNEKGCFYFNKSYTPEPVEKHSVVIHPYELWFFLDGKWLSAWKLKSGPAPESLEFRCNINKDNEIKCLTSWNHQDFR